MMMQSKGKKTTTINIDKINGIENENEIGSFGFTDEMKVQLIESFKPLKSFGIANLTEGLSLPRIQEQMIETVSMFATIQKTMEGYGSPVTTLMQGINLGIDPKIFENLKIGIGSLPSHGLGSLSSETIKRFAEFPFTTPLMVFPNVLHGLTIGYSERLKEVGKLISESFNKAFPELGEFMNETKHLSKEEADKEYLDYIHWKENFKDEYNEMYGRMEANLKSRGCILPNLPDFFQFYVLCCRTLYGFLYLDFARHRIEKKDFILYNKFENLMLDYNICALDAILHLEAESKNQSLSTPPAPKEIGQVGKVIEKVPYKKEEDIMKELDKFKKAVTDICLTIKGLPNDKIPTIAEIRDDALRGSSLTERVVTSNIKNSTTLIKTGLKTETTTGHIRQIVGQFFNGNDLILRKLKLNA
jgi:hypothetical protein